MPTVRPFRAVRYNLKKVDLNAVVAPPYDVIGAEEQNDLYQRHPNNVIRLILGREEDRYSSAAKFFQQWLDEGILLRDVTPAMHYLVQAFVSDGKEHERRGVILRCKLEEFEKRIVLPHERTLSKPKEDRLRLLQYTKANLSQIFSFYSDRERTVEKLFKPFLLSPPLMHVSHHGVENRVWSITDSTALEAVTEFFEKVQVYIADGHHRYETALTYRDMQKRQDPRASADEPYDYVMMYLTNTEEPGLVSLPTHRLVYGLREFDQQAFRDRLCADFVCEPCEDFALLKRGLMESQQHTFGMIMHGDPSFYLVRVRRGTQIQELVGRSTPEVLAGLDVTLLHRAVLERILHITSDAQSRQTNLEYVHEAEDALKSVRTGRAQIGFLMNPTRIEQIRSVATKGHVLPQKSTYFYPKLLSGLLINRLDD